MNSNKYLQWAYVSPEKTNVEIDRLNSVSPYDNWREASTKEAILYNDGVKAGIVVRYKELRDVLVS